MFQLSPEQWTQLAQYHHQRQDFRNAELAYRQILHTLPNHAPTLRALGNQLGQSGDLQSAVDMLRLASSANPFDPVLYTDLGYWLGELHHFDQAIVAYQQVLRLAPGSVLARCNLAAAYDSMGELDAAIDLLREAIQLDPHNAARHSSLIFLMQFHTALGASIREELEAWSRRHAQPIYPLVRYEARILSPERPLRVGYVCPNFNDHALGRYLLPLFEHHDPTSFEVYCYSDVAVPDALTQRFNALSRQFRSIVQSNDQQVAELIRQDSIDILVDTTLHMASNRLLLFAQKPAPIQVTFGGYPGSTGLSTVDFRLTDSHLDPPDADTSIYCEKTLRAMRSFWCYLPPAESPDINDLPALTSGHVTFGCLNTIRKINAPLLETWAKVLHAVSGARLVMLAPSCARAGLLDTFQRHGIDPQRISFHYYLPRAQYLALFHGVDISLDTLPSNGHTTSLESLYMGVPVVSQVGNTVVGRAGFSQLTNLGLTELIASSEDHFVQIAASLARDLPRLANLRQTLRATMRASPLMNAAEFAGDIELAYRSIWRKHCVSAVNAR